MRLKSVKVVSFSPTGNSKKVAKSIAEAINIEGITPIEYVDLTPPAVKTQDFPEFNDELVIIASPVYVGRIPSEAAYRLRRLKANNTPTVLVITYGNRAYEDALREISDIVSEVGFKPIAASAFIGEHSFMTSEKPIAQGRPDIEDLAKAEAFGKEIKKKYEGIEGIEGFSPLHAPGVNPYTLRAKYHEARKRMSPHTVEELCNLCGKCAEVCPTAAVKTKKVVSTVSPRAGLNSLSVSTDENTCIWCCACVKNCPTGARIRSPRMLGITGNLSNNYPERKEPETYL